MLTELQAAYILQIAAQFPTLLNCISMARAPFGSYCQ